MVRRVGEAAVADRTGRVLDQIDHVLRAVHVARTEPEVAPLAQHRLAEVDVGAGVVLAADADDLVTAAAGHLDAQLAPGVNVAALTVEFGQLLQRNLVERVVGMDVHRQRVEADDELDRLVAVSARQLDLGVLHLAARVRDVDRAVDHCRDTGPRPAARHRDDGLGRHGGVALGPRLGHIDQSVGALVLDQVAGTAAAAGDEQGGGKHQSEQGERESCLHMTGIPYNSRFSTPAERSRRFVNNP